MSDSSPGFLWHPRCYLGCALGTYAIDEIRVVQKFPQSWWQRQDVSEDTFAPETSTFNDYAVLPCPVIPQLIFPPSFFTGLAPPGLSSAL